MTELEASPKSRDAPGQAALLLILVATAILSVAGIALQLSTSSERAIAVNEWAAARALYGADAGIRWAALRLRAPDVFLSRPEFRDPPDPFGSVVLPLPAHLHGPGGTFSGDPAEDGVRVAVHAPSFLGRRPDPAMRGFHYLFEVRVRAAENAPVPRFARELVADVEVGPLPDGLAESLSARRASSGAPVLAPAAAAGGVERGWTRALLEPAIRGAIIRHVRSTVEAALGPEGEGLRSVTMNWKEP